MKLHRVGKLPDWETVPSRDRNVFQKVAAKSRGVITPGNVATLWGAFMVGSGLKDISGREVTKGVFKVSLGRVADLFDGLAAETTGTKSPLGEGADVVTDKLETAAALPVLVKADILPMPPAGLIFAQNMANTVFSVVAKCRGIELHSSREGKRSTFGQWATMGFYGLAAAAREKDYDSLAQGLRAAGQASAAATAVLGTKALAGYAREALGAGTGRPG